MNHLISGLYEIEVLAPDPPPKDEYLNFFAQKAKLSQRDFYFEELTRTLDAVADAMEHHLFAPGRMTRCVKQPPQTQGNQTRLIRTLETQALPAGTFWIVDGMLSAFSYLFPTLIGYHITGPTRIPVTLQPLFPQKMEPHLFPVKKDAIKSNNPIIDNLIITVDFKAPVPEDERNRLIHGFTTWERLLVGGFRMDNDPGSWSNVGASELEFALPDRLQWQTDTLMSHPACFDTLLNMLGRWHQTLPIQEVSIG